MLEIFCFCTSTTKSWANFIFCVNCSQVSLSRCHLALQAERFVQLRLCDQSVRRIARRSHSFFRPQWLRSFARVSYCLKIKMQSSEFVMKKARQAKSPEKPNERLSRRIMEIRLLWELVHARSQSWLPCQAANRVNEIKTIDLLSQDSSTMRCQDEREWHRAGWLWNRIHSFRLVPRPHVQY